MCDEMLVAHTGRGDASTSYLPRERRRHSGTPDLLVPALTFGLSYEASWYPPTTQDEASVAAPPSGASTWRALGTPSGNHSASHDPVPGLEDTARGPHVTPALLRHERKRQGAMGGQLLASCRGVELCEGMRCASCVCARRVGQSGVCEL